MKNLLIPLLFICVLGSAQTRPIAIIGYHIGTVALGAIADAQFDEGNKNLAHMLHATEVVTLISGPFIFDVKRNEALAYILSYGFLRFSFFDSAYNLTRDLPILFNGSTSTYDRVMNTVPEHGRAFMKSWSLVVGVSIPIKYF